MARVDLISLPNCHCKSGFHWLSLSTYHCKSGFHCQLATARVAFILTIAAAFPLQFFWRQSTKIQMTRRRRLDYMLTSPVGSEVSMSTQPGTGEEKERTVSLKCSALWRRWGRIVSVKVSKKVNFSNMSKHTQPQDNSILLNTAKQDCPASSVKASLSSSQPANNITR